MLAPDRKATRQKSNQKGSKQDVVIGMLRDSGGTSIAEIMAATGWQEHSVRGFLAAVVKKRLGLNLASEKREGKRRYWIMPGSTPP